MTTSPPISFIEPVTEVFYGRHITDNYRWLEQQDSPRTRKWIADQTAYARSYLEALPSRPAISTRVRDFLAVESHDSVMKFGGSYFFRKRVAEERPCVYRRRGRYGQDQLLIDPRRESQNAHVTVLPLLVSPQRNYLLYQIRTGGAGTGVFKILDLNSLEALPDVLPRGRLRGFGFTPEEDGFYYVHEPAEPFQASSEVAYYHVLGTEFSMDREMFRVPANKRTRLYLMGGGRRLGFLIYHFGEKIQVDFYLKETNDQRRPQKIFERGEFTFNPEFLGDRIFAVTNRDAPNLRIVELGLHEGRTPEWTEVVPESDCPIQQWRIVERNIYVLCSCRRGSCIRIFDLSGHLGGEIPLPDRSAARLLGGSVRCEELLFETQSLLEPPRIFCYSKALGHPVLFAGRMASIRGEDYSCEDLFYSAEDGTEIPMLLVGRKELFDGAPHPLVMTAYGGFGVSAALGFSTFSAFLLEAGCLLAIPGIRGGSEFGAAWHRAAKRHFRQVAYDDFLSAAEWLVGAGRTSSDRLCIFGASNAGLLVAALMTQRPQLFRAVVCIAPLTDMLRYHLFDDACSWIEEFGTAEDEQNFAALIAYSPYHRVLDGAKYPATLIVSGDADNICNPLHARKMTARLQAATASEHPVLLDYRPFRGHSPGLPLSDRVESLTDRLSFVCDQLRLPVVAAGESACS